MQDRGPNRGLRSLQQPARHRFALQNLDQDNTSDLYRRRKRENLMDRFCVKCKDPFTEAEEIVKAEGYLWHQECFVAHQNAPASFLDSDIYCNHCQEPTTKDDALANYNGRVWHTRCFVCAHCFQQLQSNEFYEFEGRKYCVDDFNFLFAPTCDSCKSFITGRMVRAIGKTWHPACFKCEKCTADLTDSFKWFNGKALCAKCQAKEKDEMLGRYICSRCNSVIDEGHIKYKGESYHCYHFSCFNCSEELSSNAREKDGELFCLRCFDKMGVSICGACRRPIEERVVFALGKTWHIEHFACAKCEKPFLGHPYFEKKGLAYCELHFHQLFGNICFHCNQVINANEVFTALNKNYCVEHFTCSICEKAMGLKSKFYEFDMKPVCKGCFNNLPNELRKRLRNAFESMKIEEK